MANAPQSYANHTRWYPLVHFVITPLLTFNLIARIVFLVQELSWQNGFDLLVAIALILLSFAARLQALKAQDRVIRLEERLRYQRLLSPDLADRAGEIRTGQIIALRFASDAELPALVQRVLNGDFQRTKEIKLAIKDWRGDYLRV